MSKSIIGEQAWVELTERPRTESVRFLSRKPKPRFGLPEGFRPSLQQYGRSVLLEDNVYSLPSGQEFIPNYPTGLLGKLRHLYALLTVEQFEGGNRGSVYVRTDGRIFDYSVDHADSSRDMFDTGYTIYDLERTGRYAPNPGLGIRDFSCDFVDRPRQVKLDSRNHTKPQRKTNCKIN